MMARRGITLLEVLVVFGIFAVLLGILLPAVQAVREVASRTESANKLRQVIIATNGFASTHNGRLPTWNGSRNDANSDKSLFVAILPHMEQSALVRGGQPITAFVSPADPSYDRAIRIGLASYAANSRVFQNNPRVDRSIPDGASNTIGFAEHYAVCEQSDGYQVLFAPRLTGDLFPYEVPIFGWKDPDLTFQVAPPANRCISVIAQTPHRAGMVTALMDGSVRIISPGISYATYWAAVTPAGGERMGPDW